VVVISHFLPCLHEMIGRLKACNQISDHYDNFEFGIVLERF